MANKKQKVLSHIPPVNQILAHAEIQRYVEKFSQSLVVSIIQQEIQGYQSHLLNQSHASYSRDSIQAELISGILNSLTNLSQPSLRRVINATGIILHTGLGRAPLTEEARENIIKVSEGYCSLEIDIPAGGRGDRTQHVEELLRHLTGAEAACVVNNNAAAVMLTLNTLCFEREAVISRGQLIEIGGSFRIPEVMQKSGVKMVEVGATNKTHLRDYENAINDNTGLICIVHPSNFRIKGFTTEPELAHLVELGKKQGLPLFQDLGGGILVDLREFGLPYEPVVSESVRQGVDVISFSGDKVLGGPQCGIIVGKKAYLDKIKKNPIMRALRCDKLIYAALEPTLKLYLEKEQLPTRNRVFAMLLESVDGLTERAGRLLEQLSGKAKTLGQIQIEESTIQIGSGALPLEELSSKALSLQCADITTQSLAEKFRMYDPAIIGYIRADKLFFDLRTVARSEEPFMLMAIEEILTLSSNI
ncbi:MAG: L-seryl-tRNA(Sec) selenium transferase [bacterium]